MKRYEGDAKFRCRCLAHGNKGKLTLAHAHAHTLSLLFSHCPLSVVRSPNSFCILRTHCEMHPDRLLFNFYIKCYRMNVWRKTITSSWLWTFQWPIYPWRPEDTVLLCSLRSYHNILSRLLTRFTWRLSGTSTLTFECELEKNGPSCTTH